MQDPGFESQHAPGLDLHEWETRWAELEEALDEAPYTALPMAVDVVEAAVGSDSTDVAGTSTATELDDETIQQVRYARQVADRIEAGDDVDAGDVGAAVQALRDVHDRFSAGRGA